LSTKTPPILHFVCLNKSGHALHFLHSLPHEKNITAPWWFLGSFEGIRKSQLEYRLKQSQRKLVTIIKYNPVILVIFYIIWLFLFFPWMTCWCLWIISWNIYWYIHAKRKIHNDHYR
jgi:hypothetical protein